MSFLLIDRSEDEKYTIFDDETYESSIHDLSSLRKLLNIYPNLIKGLHYDNKLLEISDIDTRNKFLREILIAHCLIDKNYILDIKDYCSIIFRNNLMELCATNLIEWNDDKRYIELYIPDCVESLDSYITDAIDETLVDIYENNRRFKNYTLKLVGGRGLKSLTRLCIGLSCIDYIDVTELDTKNVESINQFIDGASSLIDIIGFNNLDFSNVKDMDINSLSYRYTPKNIKTYLQMAYKKIKCNKYFWNKRLN